ncbi:unnamed protein product (macronuclear) [Paramecium tetraurelia]|uniref:non-specific serine/threonine protein kinase n=1 Tax=Paramecium tetraurelia TaxID=5888 RepID=A0BNH8_PARTE|nr:uncharacterized protein GSPATT00030733001 [Paramecium tetraurelia]CAK60095.1 unnamed protein product [Paramecium tetraurelia]|eukprot:XP_001427493.1 hypothetical protein (macronuclear) [Paramecium tetraurelia strain d4-2]
MKSKPFSITSSIFTSPNSQFWNDQDFQKTKENFKDDYFLFFSNKKLTYLNKPLQKAGSIIRKQKKNGLYLWCDVSNALIELIEIQHVGHGLRITKNQQSIQFFGYVDAWFKDLKKFCIQRKINESYIINNKIGCGSYADVYKVTRKADNKDFAAKIYDKSSDKFDPECIIKEIDILRKMDHPNVISLLETFETQKYIFLITELFIYGSLDDVITKTPFTEEEVLRGMYKIIDALSNIHSKGIIHRDIKPENILFRKPNLDDILISDFGLADYYNQEGLYQYQRCGTPGNMAPEILNDQPYDYKIDSYSAGLIFYQMLSFGRSPFIVEDYQETLIKNQQGLIDYSEINASPQAKALLQQMLEVDPIKRCTINDAKFNPLFKKFNRMTIIIKRKRILQDQTVSSYSPRSTSIYQTPSNSPQVLKIPKNKSIGLNTLHCLPNRVRSMDSQLFPSPRSCNSGGNSAKAQCKQRNRNFKINVKNSIYQSMSSTKAI